MNAHNALARLSEFPAYRHDLAEVLELSRALAQQPGDYSLAGVVAKRMARLGAILDASDQWEQICQEREQPKTLEPELVK